LDLCWISAGIRFELAISHEDNSGALRSSLVNLIKRIEPDEIYNLGAQSHVRVSFDMARVHGLDP
jgi:GDP-D-mannose dehydratase